MKLYRIAFSLFLASCTALANADVDLQLGFGSEYVRSGIKESSAQPVLQGGAVYSHQSGLYGGAWATTINQKKYTTHSEFDFYGGWYFPITTTIASDMGYTRYTFHGDQVTDKQAYGEGFLNLLFWDATTIGYRHSDDYKGSGEELQTLELAHTFNGEEFGFEFSMRQYRYLHTTEDANFGSENRADYFHFRFGVARTFDNADYSVALERTNLGSNYDGGTQILFNYNYNFSL